MILISGRTSLRIKINPGALKQNSPTLIVTPGFDRRGPWICTIDQRSDGQGGVRALTGGAARQRGEKRGSARRCIVGVWSREGSRRPKCAWVCATWKGRARHKIKGSGGCSRRRQRGVVADGGWELAGMRQRRTKTGYGPGLTCWTS
jgi:hypothetical protein